MAKNRDYTGLVRTPSSMAWLIRKRSVVRGKIERLEKTLLQLPVEIATLKQNLDALDAVIPLHEVVVDPLAIVGRRPRRRNVLPWGNMTRHILNYLRTEGRPLYSADIAMHVAKLENVDFTKFSKAWFSRRVGRQLKSLASKGLLERHHPSKTSAMGLWSLRADLDD